MFLLNYCMLKNVCDIYGFARHFYLLLGGVFCDEMSKIQPSVVHKM